MFLAPAFLCRKATTVFSPLIKGTISLSGSPWRDLHRHQCSKGNSEGVKGKCRSQGARTILKKWRTILVSNVSRLHSTADKLWLSLLFSVSVSTCHPILSLKCEVHSTQSEQNLCSHNLVCFTLPGCAVEDWSVKSFLFLVLLSVLAVFVFRQMLLAVVRRNFVPSAALAQVVLEQFRKSN